MPGTCVSYVGTFRTWVPAVLTQSPLAPGEWVHIALTFGAPRGPDGQVPAYARPMRSPVLRLCDPRY
eukprot:3790617-Rhodomonas_salina.2